MNNMFSIKNLIAICLILLMGAGGIAAEQSVSYQYDRNNRLRSVTYADGNSINYTYDDMGNISQITTVKSAAAAPEIIGQPEGQTVVAGNLVALYVTATGSGTLSYQWRKDGVDIAGATDSNYSVDSIAVADTGDYDVIVSNSYGSVTSQVATLLVNAAEGTVKIMVSGSGSTKPSASTARYPLGETQSVSATADDGNEFTFWSLSGSASLENAFSSITNLTISGDAVLTANFAAKSSTAKLTVGAEHSSQGDVEPSGAVTVPIDTDIEICAVPAQDYYFIGWTAVPAQDSSDFNAYAAKTVVNIKEDSVFTAKFAKSPESTVVDGGKSKEKISIKMDNSAKKKDSASVGSMSLSAHFPLASFNTTKIENIVIDGETFDFSGGVWKSSTSKVSYKSAKDATPTVSFSIALKDTSNPVCSFKISKATFTQIDNSDGVDIFIAYDGETYGKNYLMDEKSSWSFNSKKDSSVPIEEIPLSPMTKFGAEKVSGKYSSAKKLKLGIPQSKDSLAVSKAIADCPAPSAGEKVNLVLDDYSKIIELDSFEKKGNKYSYQSKADGIKMLLDFDKKVWNFKASNADLSGVSQHDGIDLFLSVGLYEGAEHLNVKHKTTLTYPSKK